MNAEKAQEEKGILEKEYKRIVENKTIYSDEMGSKTKINQISVYSLLLSMLPIFWAIFALPNEIIMLEALPTHPLPFLAFFIGFSLMIVSFIATYVVSNKISKIQNELGLAVEERLYLYTYETHKNIKALLAECNPRRKIYFKKLVLENVQKTIKIVESWSYGTIPLISKLVGNQIDLMKDNLRRLVLSNVAEGNEATLKKVSVILIGLCKYIYSPSIKELKELNDLIAELPFKEYEYLTWSGKLGKYFYGKPRISRFLFAFGVAVSVAVFLLLLGQNIGVIGAVTVASFWGAFSGFDKIFVSKKD